MQQKHFRAGAVATALFLLLFPSASAKPVTTTKYEYYTVSGRTATDVYNAMLQRGPHVNGDKAYAATAATTSQEGKLASGSMCTVQNYRVRIDFTIKLPKLAKPDALKGQARANWDSFAAFLKKHEETHREIWVGCAERLEAQIAAIRVKDCGEADAKANRLWDEMRTSCALKHDAFDTAEQKRLLKQPFVRLAFASTLKQSRSAAVTPVKKRPAKNAAARRKVMIETMQLR
jgi:predicted secreted Zn-dependent protease